MRRTTLRRGAVVACWAWLLAVVPAAALVGTVATAGPAAADTVTGSSDNRRTGWDPNEPALGPSQVAAADFGQQWSTQLDGSVYAQPLVVGSTVVAVTENATAYGIDTVSGGVLWSHHFGAPFQSASIGCGDLAPNLGSTSTPVYDPATATVYLTTKIAGATDATKPTWYLQAVDVTTGASRTGYPMVLQGTANNDTSVTFDPFVQMQRPGLLLANGVVYIGFGAHCDIGAYRGWVMAVNVAGTPSIKSLWTSEVATGGQGGIWQAGGGLVSDGNDSAGNPRIFLATGNGVSPGVAAGTSTPVQGTLGDSVVRIGLNASGQLQTKDFFAPSNADQLSNNDQDLGSGGPVALPDTPFGVGTSTPHLMVEQGKDGRLFLLNRDSLGGRSQGAGGTDAVVQTLGPFNGLWGHQAVYGGEGGWIYEAENGGPLRAFKWTPSGAKAQISAVGASTETFSYTSGSPVVSSNGTAAGSGVVWEVSSSGTTGTYGTLYAYSAVPDSTGHLARLKSFGLGTVTKFAVPTTAGGRVFVGNRDGALMAFGQPSSSALTGASVDFGAVAVGGTGTATAHLTAPNTVTITAVSAAAPFGVGAFSVPALVSSGQSVDVPLTFTPTTTGGLTGTLTLATSGGAVTVDLHGAGIRSGLAATPSSVDFGTVPSNQSKTLSVLVTNTGTTDETVSSVTGPSAPFSAASLPAVGTVVAAGASAPASVTFAPTAGGTFSSSIVVTSTSGTLTIPVTGIATSGQGHLAFVPASLGFGSVVVGTSRTLPFDVTNTGTAPLTVTKAKAPSGVFSSASGLSEGITLLPGDVVHQQVTFTPKAVGAASASYEVTANDGQGAKLEVLTGTGVVGTRLPAPTGAGWTRNGDASVSGTDLYLTHAGHTAVAGSAFATSTVASSGLDAHFTAQIGGGGGADGMTFTMLDGSLPATSIGGVGGALGYGGLGRAVAVTLDTFQNGNDPSSNFVGLATGTTGSPDALTYVASSTDIASLRTGTHDVDVNVYGGHVRVSVDGSLKIDAVLALPAVVRPGFTAGNGGVTDNHVVRNVAITTPAGPAPSASPVKDAAVAREGTGTVTSVPFHTSHAGDLLVAMVSSAGRSGTRQSVTVTGAGLRWTLLRRANAATGDAEVWTARATGTLVNATVRSTPSTPGYHQLLVVLAFAGTPGVGGSAYGSSLGSAPALSVTTASPRSWVWGVGEDPSGALGRHPAVGQLLASQWVDTGGRGTYWAQSYVPGVGARARVTLRDSYPTNHRWDLVVLEIRGT